VALSSTGLSGRAESRHLAEIMQCQSLSRDRHDGNRRHACRSAALLSAENSVIGGGLIEPNGRRNMKCSVSFGFGLGFGSEYSRSHVQVAMFNIIDSLV
jgi:hypothetical protein